LLDNFPPERMREAVTIRDVAGSKTLLEASGGITLETVPEIARTGIDRISIGALTHSAPILDLSMDLD
jgi:nicotinate-nucleotide pyrophosphorylase (carboxylating)